VLSWGGTFRKRTVAETGTYCNTKIGSRRGKAHPPEVSKEKKKSN